MVTSYTHTHPPAPIYTVPIRADITLQYHHPSLSVSAFDFSLITLNHLLSGGVIEGFIIGLKEVYNMYLIIIKII